MRDCQSAAAVDAYGQSHAIPSHLTVDLCEGNKIISLKKIYFTTASWGPLKKEINLGALGTCLVCPVEDGPAKTTSSLASFKSRWIVPFWYRLTQVVLESVRIFTDCFINSAFSVTIETKCSQMSVCATTTNEQ